MKSAPYIVLMALGAASGCISGLDTNPSGAGGTTSSSGGGVAPIDVCKGGVERTLCGPHVAVGDSHSCALRAGGEVRCWGLAIHGQLGYANTTNIGDNEKPRAAGSVQLGAAVVQLTAGYHHNCGLFQSGSVRCWGRSNFGQLGYGNLMTIGDDERPDSVGAVDLGAAAVGVVAGHFHTCALSDTGGVRCWGKAEHGQLGYGSTETIGDDETPSSAGEVDVGGVVVQLAAGHAHTCALLETGKVRCWGQSNDGQLGYGNTNTIGDDETPSSVAEVDVGGVVVQLAAGYAHTCARLAAGTVRCWGAGQYGQLGYGNTQTIGDDEVPSSAGDVDVGLPVVDIATGNEHSCAVLVSGKVRCWGRSKDGQLGYGNTQTIGDDEVPSSAGDVDVGSGVVQLSAGGYHGCALLVSGGVSCWGRSNYGQLGYESTATVGDDEPPSSAGEVFID